MVDRLTCPKCGGPVEEPPLWLRWDLFYCSAKCAEKASRPGIVLDPYRLPPL